MSIRVETEPRALTLHQAPSASVPRSHNQLLRLAGLVFLLSVCFGKPLFDLARYAAKEDLYSHIFVVPIISIYLAWINRRTLKGTLNSQPSTLNRSLFPLILGFIALATYFLFGRDWRFNDYLSITIFAYVCFVIGGASFCLGRALCRQFAFPLAFLLFMVPFPAAVTHGIEVFFQHTSAAAANILFIIVGTPVFREGMSFHFPGFALRVAEECSGIRSSFVLFITSLLAGHLFLRASWKRWLLALVVIPLGIVRNGIRIVTIALLCVHVDPTMIDSPIHHHGGPLFFALSLIPFFALLLWLWRSERTDH